MPSTEQPQSPVEDDASDESGQNASAPRICFLHIPKCGGTTIDRALSRHYAADQQVRMHAHGSFAAAKAAGQSLMDYRHDQVPLMLSTPGGRYVCGHFPFNEAAHERFRDQWKFITLLREPVSRWFSEYFYNRHSPGGHFSTELDLETYVAQAGPSTAFSGKLTHATALSSSEDRVQAAISTLERLDAVGCLEQLDEFQHQLETLLGAELEVGHDRRNPLPVEKQKKTVTPAIRRRVEELCAEDTEIYEHAQQIARRVRGGARSQG